MKGFFMGVFFACPLTALIMWYVATYTSLIDTKVERTTVAAELHSAEFDQDFNQRWAEMGGVPATCSTVSAGRIADLKRQLADLRRQMDTERQAAVQQTSNLDQIIDKKEPEKNEKH